MFQNAQEFIEYICQRRKGKKERLNDYSLLLDRLGHLEKQLKTIHVAGTNGKGSVTNYLRSILQTAGYRVGTFTSPHLIVHNDRIRINDVDIPDEKLLDLANRYQWCWDEYDLSMFEIDMILSLFYFTEEQVDYVIYEVGLGGRFDPTNVIEPIASVIVNIGYDHMEILGDTLDKIAFEKAGIIKKNIPVFTIEDKEECLKVFNDVAKQKDTVVYRIYPSVPEVENNHISFVYRDYDVKLNTIALYQAKNATLALAVADWLSTNNIISMTKEDILSGLEHTFWKGRFEIMKEKPLIIVDGAHNQHGVSAVLDSIRQLPHPKAVVASILKDKQYQQMLRMLKSVSDELIVTEFDNYRVTHTDELAKDIEVTVIPDWQQALEYVEKKYEDGSIVLTGSLYFVSEVRAYYKKGETK